MMARLSAFAGCQSTYHDLRLPNVTAARLWNAVGRLIRFSRLCLRHPAPEHDELAHIKFTEAMEGFFSTKTVTDFETARAAVEAVAVDATLSFEISGDCRQVME